MTIGNPRHGRAIKSEFWGTVVLVSSIKLTLDRNSTFDYMVSKELENVSFYAIQALMIPKFPTVPATNLFWFIPLRMLLFGFAV